MILKILPRHSLSGIKQLLAYIEREGKGIDGKADILLHNVRSRDISGQVKEFLQNEAYRASPIRKGTTVFIRHEIISFSKNDTNITAEILRDVANKYIEVRGITGMYVGAIHGDREHYHIHFATSGCQFKTGKSFHPKRPELQRIKQELQQYHREKYPELTANSLCEHGAGRGITDREYQLKKRTGKTVYKEELAEKVKRCFSLAKTQQQFFDLLQNEDLLVYERNGTAAQGIIFNNKKHRFRRLGIELNTLAIDLTEEDRILNELSALRNKVRERSRDRDMER